MSPTALRSSVESLPAAVSSFSADGSSLAVVVPRERSCRTLTWMVSRSSSAHTRRAATNGASRNGSEVPRRVFFQFSRKARSGEARRASLPFIAVSNSAMRSATADVHSANESAVTFGSYHKLYLDNTETFEARRSPTVIATVVQPRRVIFCSRHVICFIGRRQSYRCRRFVLR